MDRRRSRPLIAGLCAAVALGVAAPAASARFIDPDTFRSPTGNIACGFINYRGWHARCDIKQHSWKDVHKPRSCHLDFSNGLVVGSRGRAYVLCASDEGPFDAKVLPYGHSMSRGDIRCTSMTTGVECVTAHPRHGFLISRNEALLF